MSSITSFIGLRELFFEGEMPAQQWELMTQGIRGTQFFLVDKNSPGAIRFTLLRGVLDASRN